MRYFVRVCKTVAFVSFQINNTFATYLRKGDKRGAIRVHGKDALYQGSGWYKMAIEPQYVNELIAAAKFLIGRLKNFRMLRSAKPVEAIKSLQDTFAFANGFFTGDVCLTAKRVLKVTYRRLNGAPHPVPVVLNRLWQASEGYCDYLSSLLNKAIGAQPRVSEAKLAALQARFSH